MLKLTKKPEVAKMTRNRQALLLLLTGLLSIGCSNSSELSLSLSPTPQHGPIVADSGSTVVINCLLKGSSYSSSDGFRWNRDRVELRNSEQTRVLIQLNSSGTRSSVTIYNVDQTDEGVYTCTHTDVPGASEGIGLEVIVQAHYRNMSSTMVQNFTVGENATILCPAFLGDPPGTMTWLRGDTFLSSSVDPRYNTRSDMLTIARIRTEDSGVYKCQIYRDIQGLLPERNIAVNVFENSPMAPVINKIGQHRVQSFEHPLDLTCDILSGDEPVTVTWYIRTGLTVAAVSNRTLHREPMDYSSGEYRCRATNSHGSDSFNIFVEVQAPPRPQEVHLAKKTAKEGSVIILSYQTLPPPIDTDSLEFEWKKRGVDGEFVTVPLRGRITKNPLLGLLTINNVKQSDAGEYQVNISNVHGFSLQTMSLGVEGLQTPEPTVTTQVPVNGWFHFEISSESSVCSELQVEELSAALESLLCTTASCDVSVDEIRCSSETNGQFSASVAESQQNKFTLTVNGVQLAVTSCGTVMCPTTSPDQHPGPSMTTVSVIVVLAVVIVTMSMVGAAIGIAIWKYKKYRPKPHRDIENQLPTATAVPLHPNNHIDQTNVPRRPRKLSLKATTSNSTMTPGRSFGVTPELDKYEQCSPAMAVEDERRKLSPKPRFQRSLSCGAAHYGSYSKRLVRNT